MCLGVSHHRTPIETREKFALSPEEIHTFYGLYRSQFVGDEVFILSTCNRTEFYAFTPEPGSISTWIHSGLKRLGRELNFDENHLVAREGTPAVQHFFRVCAGLDSMVLGETQITAQVKNALEIARDSGVAGAVIQRMVQFGLEASKAVRTKTEISSGAFSISYAAVKKVREIHPNLRNKTMLLIGAGSMGKLTAIHFKKKGIGKILVSNRNESRGKTLAELVNGQFIPLTDVDAKLDSVDVIVTCTGAPFPMVNKDQVESIDTDVHPLLLIDLSVPRNIQTDLGNISGVTLFSIDDMRHTVKAQTELRKKEMPKAEKLISEKLDEFQVWLKNRSVSPAIADLKHHFEDIRQAEFNNIQHRHDEETLEAIYRFSNRLIRRYLKQPIHTLKESANAKADSDALVQSLRQLYELDELTETKTDMNSEKADE